MLGILLTGWSVLFKMLKLLRQVISLFSKLFSSLENIAVLLFFLSETLFTFDIFPCSVTQR